MCDHQSMITKQYHRAFECLALDSGMSRTNPRLKHQKDQQPVL